MPITLPDLTDEEKKRRAIAVALSVPGTPQGLSLPPGPPMAPMDSPPPRPGILDNSLPAPSNAGPLPSPGAPPAYLSNRPPITDRMPGPVGTPESTPPPPTRYSQEQALAGDYMDKAGQHRWRTAALSALGGFMRGIGTGGGLAAGLAGAATGFGAGAINPRGVARADFNANIRPGIREGWASMDQQAAAQRQQQQDAMNDRLNEARLGVMGSEATKNNAEARKALSPPAPARQPAAQMRLGRNRTTGQIDYYNALDPEDRKAFEPYQMPRQTPAARPQRPTNPPAAAFRASANVDSLKRAATNAWRDVSTKTAGSPERAAAERKAQQALEAYNGAVHQLGDTFPDVFETGPGQGGWNYYKRKQGAPAQTMTQTIAQPSGQKKAPTGFIDYVARRLGVSPDKAKQMIEDDQYTIQ